MRSRLGLLALWLLAGCGADRGVTIGVLMWGPTGPDVTRVAQAWLAEQGPGLPPVRFVVDSAPPQDGRTVHASVRWLEAAEAMVRHRDLIAVIGHIGSRESLVTAPIYARARVPLIVPTGTSHLLGMAGPWVLPLAPGETAEGNYLVRQATERFGARTITVFQFNDEYGVGLGEAVVTEAVSAGLTVLDRALVPFGALADYDAALGASLLRGTPDLVIVAARPAALAGVTRALRSRGLAIPVLAGDGADSPPTLAALGADTLDGAYFATFWRADAADPADRDFARRFREATGHEPTAADALTWDAVRIVIEAVRAGARTPDAVRIWIRERGSDAPSFTGVTGPVAFGEGQATPRFVLVSTRALETALP